MNDSPGWASPGPASSDPSRPEGDVPDSPGTGPEEAAPPDAVPPTWSKTQPPPQAGGWATPPPPPRAPSDGRPQQNWGPPPSWGAFLPPPAPQPGVIPLRPLGLGEILQGAIAMMRIHWRTALGVSLLVALITDTVSTLVGQVLLNDSTALERLQSEQTPTPSDVLHELSSLAGSTGATILIGMLGQIFATAMLTIVVSRSVLGRPVTAGEAWRDARPRLPHLLLLTLLIPLISACIVAVGVTPGVLVAVSGHHSAGLGLASLGLLAASPVVLWIAVSLSLAAPALMLERQGAIAALRRSMRLVRGSWWRVLGVQVVNVVLGLMIISMVSVPFGILAGLASGQNTALMAGGTVPTGWTALVLGGIGEVIGSTLTLPLSAGISALLYVDLRIRREGLDLELARAAGNGQ